MRFLIDADLSPVLISIFEEFGHEAVHAGTLDLGRAPDLEIAAFARNDGRGLLTGDFDFANLLDYEPRRYAGIVVLTLPREAMPPYIEFLVRYFLEQLPELLPLEGKLVIVESHRIRVRT